MEEESDAVGEADRGSPTMGVSEGRSLRRVLQWAEMERTCVGEVLLRR